MITTQNETPDWSVIENVKERARLGTHLAPGAAEDALFVERDSSTLGANQSALSVRAGAATLAGVDVSIDAAQSIDIAEGGGQDRRDVVYLTTGGGGDPEIRVREGAEGDFVWGDGVDEDDRTIANAYRPAPYDMGDVDGLVLAIVTIPRNTSALQTGSIAPVRAVAPGTGITASEISPDSINGILYFPADAEDFGAAMNDLLSTCSGGETIVVPPAAYDTATTAVVDVPNVTIHAEGDSTPPQPGLPNINCTADVPVFETREHCRIEGLGLYNSGNKGETSGIVMHSTGRIDRCHIGRQGAHGTHIDNESDGNSNNIRVTDTTVRYCAGDGVRVTDAGASNTNGLEINLRLSYNNAGWGINAPDGFGNHYRILNHGAPSGGAGGMLVGGSHNKCEIIYHEGVSRPTFQLDGDRNEAVLYRTGPNNDNIFEDNGTRNTKRQFSRDDQPTQQVSGTTTVDSLGVGSITETYLGSFTSTDPSTFETAYDGLRLRTKRLTTNANGAGDLWLRVNNTNETGYQVIHADGTSRSGDNRFRLVEIPGAGTYHHRGEVVVWSDGTGACTLSAGGLTSTVLGKKTTQGVASPVTSRLTGFNMGATSASLLGAVRVFGLTF